MNRSFSRVASALAALFVLGASATALASDWDVDSSHSTVGFGVKHYDGVYGPRLVREVHRNGQPERR